MPLQGGLKFAGCLKVVESSSRVRSTHSTHRAVNAGCLLHWFWRRMGDEGENLDTQLGSVDEQLRRVEEQLRSVEGQIRRVEEQIQSAEEQIEKCPDGEERKLLRGKEAQLRGKEAQLRGKEAQLRADKAQLRDEKAQALQRRDEYTECEWLCQTLPLWDSGRGVMTPSATHKERMHTPVKVEFWDVEGDIEGYLANADSVKRRFQKMEHHAATIAGRSVLLVAGSVVGSTCDFVSRKQSGVSLQLESEARLELPRTPVLEEGDSEDPDKSRSEDKEVAKCLFYGGPPRADILVKSNDIGVAVVELKNGGLGCPVRIHTLWARCSCQTGTDLNCWCNSGVTKGKARSLLDCICQVYEYLVLAKVGYGVLTDIQNWYLFKRDHAGFLYISRSFQWNDRQPPLPAAIGYLVSCAVDAGGEVGVSPEEGERPWSWEVTPTTSPSGGWEDDEDKDPSYDPNEDRIGSSEASSHRAGGAYSRRTRGHFQEIPASDLHLDDRPISDEGWSGCVVGGRLNGRRVAVKLAPHKSERAEALVKEVDAYVKLQEHWGVFVPPLVGYGTTAGGRIVYIATELIDGSPLGPATVTEEVASAALQALHAVHACNVLHGDVEARNIMVVRGTEPSVRLVDFGFAKWSTNRNLQKAELRELQRLLEDLMGTGVWRQSNHVTYPQKQICLV